jgi:hypothetical protein
VKGRPAAFALASEDREHRDRYADARDHERAAFEDSGQLDACSALPRTSVFAKLALTQPVTYTAA